MSRGPGRIERAVRQLMTDEPGGAWTVEDIAEKVYPVTRTTGVEKKHRVSVVRALKRITENDVDWVLWQSRTRGGTIVLVNLGNLQSYALGNLKADNTEDYRRKDGRYVSATENDLKKQLESDGRKHKWIQPGPDGHWWRHVQMHIARRDGHPNEELEKEQADYDQMVAMTVKAIRAMMG